MPEQNKKIANNIDEIEAMAGMKEGVMFYTRAKRDGTIEVVFESKDMARRHSTQTKKMEKWLMFSMYEEL